MSPIAVNRTAEMEVFVRVVERSGLSAAARSLGMTPSAVSKLLGRLEARLETRLMLRSTRGVELTEEGAVFYERCVRLLGEIADAERAASPSRKPKGQVRINSSVPFGITHLVPLVPLLLERHPELTLDLVLTDQVVDLVTERSDIAIRVGPLRSSQLMARKLGESRMLLVGAPSYLAKRGTPTTLEELETHARLSWGFARTSSGWPFSFRGVDTTLQTNGPVAVGDGETMRQLVLSGAGLARLAWFHVAADVRAGRLVPVMEDHNPGDRELIHAVFIGQGRVPMRVRAVLDFLAESVRIPAFP